MTFDTHCSAHAATEKQSSLSNWLRFSSIFLLLIGLWSGIAQAAHPDNVPPRTSMCDPIPNTGAHHYSVFVGCWFRIVRPLGDTGGPLSGRPPLPLQFGFHYPLQFPGIAGFSAPGYACRQANVNGHGRILCDGNTPENGSTQIDVAMHVQGACGTAQSINVVVSNPGGAIGGPLFSTIQFPACPTPPPPPSTCSDGVDNDGDTFVDFPADPGCSSAQDDSEINPNGPECDDGRDNDGDNVVDFPRDPGCTHPSDPSERETNGPACDNGRDDDGDGLTDFPADPGCSGPTDGDERNPNGPQCDNGIDDDGDHKTDFPADPGCDSPQDPSEKTPNAECDDGVDNDHDGLTDFPQDPGCTGPGDTSEKNPNGPECDDGRDNDGDGLVDFPQDPGCSSPSDPTERGQTACDNGIDDDGDGLIDFPVDPGCDSPTDTSERDPNGPRCDNGLDDDSDELIDYPTDPGCVTPDDDSEENCQPGTEEQRNCQTNSPGVCAAGKEVRTCGDDFQFGDFGACQSVTTPGQQQENCTDGLDNDCDGKTDSQDTDCRVCETNAEETESCSSGLPGICDNGWRKRVCTNAGQWGPYSACEAENQPGSVAEVCSDGLDNDCDGKTDSQDSDCRVCESGAEQSESCNAGLPGICGSGSRTRTCTDAGQWGAYSACQADHQPGEKQEVCDDAVDNDCDGKADSQDSDCRVCDSGAEETESCSSGLPGICDNGWRKRECNSSGQWGAYSACEAEQQPGAEPEICDDGLDNDCDGNTDAQDADCSSECQPGDYEKQDCDSGLIGLCAAGRRTRICDGDGNWGNYGACDPDLQPGEQAENCFDEKDNDCDGTVDLEDSDCAVCEPGETEEWDCDTGLAGVCATGKKQRTCLENQQWGSFGGCQDVIIPGEQTEICTDGVDNDCDGESDGNDEDCGTCTETDTRPLRRNLYGNFNRIKGKLLLLANRSSFTRRNHYARWISVPNRREIYQLTSQGQQFVWSIPTEINSCGETSNSCETIDLSESKEEIGSILHELGELAVEIAATGKHQNSNQAGAYELRLLDQIEKLVAESLTDLEVLPETATTCN